MPATPRQRVCIACASSKRRCDKQLPECQRCLDRDVDCVYPPPKRRRRDPLSRGGQTVELPALQNDADGVALGSCLDFAEWDGMGATDIGMSLSDVMLPFISTLPAPGADPSAQDIVFGSSNISDTQCPWFLRDETWDLQHSNQEPACVTDVEMAPFIDAVEEMLQFWVKNGHNSFIHRRLYEKGMPPCLQDAFVTLAAYTGRAPAVKETILQIADERASALVRQSPPTASGAQGILLHLARVQALFVYEFVRLFDGSVRLRVSAEKQLPILRRWLIQLWQAVRQYRGIDSSLGQRPLQWTANEFDREYYASSELWKQWIMTESVRRTHVIIDVVANTYQTMTKGLAECAGAVMFTARHGLWGAESSVKWFQLSCAKTPLLVPSLQPETLISKYAAEEVDDFVKMFWTFLVGTDKMQCWIDRSNTTSIMQPVQSDVL